MEDIVARYLRSRLLDIGNYINLLPGKNNSRHRSLEIPEEFKYISKEKKYILFIDNEMDLVEVIKEELPHIIGYDIIALTSNVDGLGLFLANPSNYILVITDYLMPEMAGISFAEKLLHLYPDIPVILSMGINNYKIEEEAIKIGVRDIIVKPFGLRELAENIKRVLKK